SPLVAPRGAPPAPGPAAAVFRALSRHPRAFLAGQDAPVSVRCATLGLTFDATPAGVRVTAHAGSFSFGVLDALDLVGDALVHVVPEAEGASALAIVVPRALRDALDELIAPVRGLLPPEAADAVRALAPALASVVPVALGASIGGRALEVAPRLRVRLDLAGGALTVAVAARYLPDAEPAPAGEGAPVVYGRDGDETVFVRRDLAAEAAARDALAGDLGLDAGSALGASRYLVDDLERGLAIVARLAEHDGAVDVEWADGRERVVTAPVGARDLTVTVGAMGTWLALRGDVGGHGLVAPLAALLEALREGRRFVPVGDDGWIRVSETLARRLAPLAEA
ncbi:MAG: hypothetical protein KC635_29555, partial [Myxococcales bacterium]|nr:hypothetical protein [Myxococcales bacterium]